MTNQPAPNTDKKTASANVCLSHFFIRSRLLARLFPFKKPAILLVSYPRSGSSWIGKMLSLSPDVAYLREPINQGYQSLCADGSAKESVIDPDSDETIRAIYTRLADDAFRGLPPKAVPNVVENLADFSPLQRAKKRLLIKEINPLATDLFVRRHAPMIVILLRHPAAVADSYDRLGWLGGKFEEFGIEYGIHLARSIGAAKNTAHTLIRYEDLARDASNEFSRLFAALAIRPPADFNKIVQEFCEQPTGEVNPYEIRRKSRHEADKWRQNLSSASIAAVMKGYFRSGLDYYRDEAR